MRNAFRLSTLALGMALAAGSVHAQVLPPVGGTNTVSGLGSAPIKTLDGSPATGGLAGYDFSNNSSWVDNPVWYAQADGATLALHTAVGAAGFGGGVATSRFSWYANVLPGSSGLAMGTPVTLTLSFKLDGALSGGMGPGYHGPVFGMTPSTFSTSSYMTLMAGLSVSNPDDQSADYPLASFAAVGGAGADVSSCVNTANACDGIDGLPTAYEATRLARQLQVNSYDFMNNRTPLVNIDQVRDVASLTLGARQELAFNTGTLSMSFQAFVGESLLFDAYTELAQQCYSAGFGSDAGQRGLECAAWGDLGHTLQGSLSSSVPGLVFDGLSGAALAAPVPEPASWGLLGLGLAGLVARRRGGK